MNSNTCTNKYNYKYSNIFPLTCRCNFCSPCSQKMCIIRQPVNFFTKKRHSSEFFTNFFTIFFTNFKISSEILSEKEKEILVYVYIFAIALT